MVDINLAKAFRGKLVADRQTGRGRGAAGQPGRPWRLWGGMMQCLVILVVVLCSGATARESDWPLASPSALEMVQGGQGAGEMSGVTCAWKTRRQVDGPQMILALAGEEVNNVAGDSIVVSIEFTAGW